MDLLFELLPFFNAGLVASVVARASGINMSMCMLMIVLYMGATPVEAVIVLLTFNTYSYFTVFSQVHRIGFKDFTFFPGFKVLIPMALTVLAIALQPFMGITIFIAFFLLEIFAFMYKKMDPDVRPTIKKVVQMCAIGSVLTTAGILVIQLFPAQWYFVFGGLVIIAYAALMWQTNNRSRFQQGWDKLLYGLTFVTGLSGIEASDWMEAQHRNMRTDLSRCYPIVVNTAMVVALMASYGVFHYFSMGAIFTTIGSAVGIRFFGVKEYTGKGKFNYLTLGLAVLAVLIFFLVQPQPTGFPALSGDFDFNF